MHRSTQDASYNSGKPDEDTMVHGDSMPTFDLEHTYYTFLKFIYICTHRRVCCEHGQTFSTHRATDGNGQRIHNNTIERQRIHPNPMLLRS